MLKGDRSFVGPRPDVSGYADRLKGNERKILLLRPVMTGPATLKYADEEEILARIAPPVRYNDEIIFPDKVRINYLENRVCIVEKEKILTSDSPSKLTSRP